MDVAGWLRGLGLGQYETNFRDNKINADVLPRLTKDDLKEIGVSALGDRRNCSTRSRHWPAQHLLRTSPLARSLQPGKGLQIRGGASPDHGDVLRSRRLHQHCGGARR